MGWSTKRFAVIVAVLAMVLAACGGSDEGAQPTTADPDSTAPVDEATTPTSPPDQDTQEPVGSDQGGDGSFCIDMNSSVAMANSFPDDDVEGRFNQGIQELEDLRARAPGDIADDVETLYESLVLLDDIFADYGYDLEAVPSDEQQEMLADTGVGEAMARISEYCGGSASAGGTASLSGAGVGSFTVDGESFDDVDVYRCEPFTVGDEEPDPEDLNLVAGFLSGSNVIEVEIGKTGTDALSMRVFYSRQGADGLEQFEGGANNSIPGRFEAGPWKIRDFETGEEVELDGPPYEISGNRITGSLSGLQQDWPQNSDGTVDVTFDLEIPDVINDCSLR